MNGEQKLLARALGGVRGRRMRPSSAARLVTLAFAAAAFPLGAAPPLAGLEERPEIVAFAGHAPPAQESFGALGQFTLALVCRADLSCAVFLLTREGEVDLKRTGALRAALDALPASAACVRPESSLSTVDGEVGQLIGELYSYRPRCLVRLDALGEPELVASPQLPALAPLILGDEPLPVIVFRKGPEYRGFLGPARVEPQLAALSGGRWVLALVTAPSSLNLYGCGERRVFVYDADARAIDVAQTQLLARALEPALNSVGVGCARRLYASGPVAFIRSQGGGKHAFEAAAEIRLGPEGKLPFKVKKVPVDSPPPMP